MQKQSQRVMRNDASTLIGWKDQLEIGINHIQNTRVIVDPVRFHSTRIAASIKLLMYLLHCNLNPFRDLWYFRDTRHRHNWMLTIFPQLLLTHQLHWLTLGCPHVIKTDVMQQSC